MNLSRLDGDSFCLPLLRECEDGLQLEDAVVDKVGYAFEGLKRERNESTRASCKANRRRGITHLGCRARGEVGLPAEIFRLAERASLRIEYDQLSVQHVIYHQRLTRLTCMPTL